MYREQSSDEEWHVNLGRKVLASTPHGELQAQAQGCGIRLELAVKFRTSS